MRGRRISPRQSLRSNLSPDGAGYRMHTRFAKVHKLAGTAYDVSLLRRRADRRHAEASPSRASRMAVRQSRLAPHQPRTQSISSARSPSAQKHCGHPRVDPASRQHAEDHGRGKKGGTRHAPGRSGSRAARRSSKVDHAQSARSRDLAANGSEALDATRLLATSRHPIRNVSTFTTKSARNSQKQAYRHRRLPSSMTLRRMLRRRPYLNR